MQSKRKTGRPKMDPKLKAATLIRFKARAYDLAGMDAIGGKRRLNRSTVIRMAIAHLVEFEGLRSEVEAKAHLLISEAVV